MKLLTLTLMLMLTVPISGCGDEDDAFCADLCDRCLQCFEDEASFSPGRCQPDPEEVGEPSGSQSIYSTDNGEFNMTLCTQYCRITVDETKAVLPQNWEEAKCSVLEYSLGESSEGMDP